ncbi:hypothetical protein QVD99_007300 [Batrachochytrium dendrobatidis]|nr:hypothetical protein QVD99_007300 [Batrachochytrium dendrobatidis]
MIVARAADSAFVLFTRHLALYLMETPRDCIGLSGLSVFVESSLKDHPVFGYEQLLSCKPYIKDRLKFWTPELCISNADTIDFIVTLGGDGTVLFASWLFQKAQVPPIIPFHLGSLGFLTVFDIADIRHVLERVIGCVGEGVRVNMRMRLNCAVYRHTKLDKPSTCTVSASTHKVSSTNSHSYPSSHQEQSQFLEIQTDDIVSTDTIGSPLDLLSKSLKATSLSDLVTSQSIPVRPHVYAQSKPTVSAVESLPLQGDATKDSIHNISCNNDCHDDSTKVHDTHHNSTKSRQPFKHLRFDHSCNALQLEPAVLTETFQILNDLVVDRGPSAYMSQLELFVDDRHLTTAQADGLVLSTPTGSTAYSLSAGGSLVHPEVPSFLITPICAHSLSFRPMLLPDSIELKVQVPLDSRNTAWASFDGRHRIELKQGDYIAVTMSRWPMPSVCMKDQSSDWFESLRRCLHWNERTRQRPLDVSVLETAVRINTGESVGSPSLETLATHLFE